MSWKRRQSGIELLKIIAMFLIVTSHIVQCIGETQLNINAASSSPSVSLLSVFFHFGVLGNDIFFLCSAWFLLDQNSYSHQKWWFLLVEAWSVSVIFLILTLLLRHGDVAGQVFVKSLFPTTFGNTWYITCYLLFYPLHPILNKIINAMSRKMLFRSVFILTILYVGINSIYRGLLYYSNLLMWIVLYFIMAYLKKYKEHFMNSSTKNLFLFTGSLFGFVICFLLLRFLGFHVSFLQNRMLYWSQINNPFIIAMSLSLLNLARKGVFQNGLINYLSSLSLLVYLAQSNLSVKAYWRPYLVDHVLSRFGTDHIISAVFGMSTLVFVLALAFGFLYNLLIAPAVKKCSSALYHSLRRLYLSLESRML